MKIKNEDGKLIAKEKGLGSAELDIVTFDLNNIWFANKTRPSKYIIGVPVKYMHYDSGTLSFAEIPTKEILQEIGFNP